MSAARFADDRDPRIHPWVELAAETRMALAMRAVSSDDIPADMVDLLVHYEAGLRMREVDRAKSQSAGVNDPRLPHGGHTISHRRYGSTVAPRMR